MPAVGEGLQQAYQQKKLARPQQKAQQEQQQRQPHRKELEGFDMDGFDLDGFDFDDSDADADEEDASYGRSNQSGPRPLEPTDGATYVSSRGAGRGVPLYLSQSLAARPSPVFRGVWLPSKVELFCMDRVARVRGWVIV